MGVLSLLVTYLFTMPRSLIQYTTSNWEISMTRRVLEWEYHKVCRKQTSTSRTRFIEIHATACSCCKNNATFQSKFLRGEHCQRNDDPSLLRQDLSHHYKAKRFHTRRHNRLTSTCSSYCFLATQNRHQNNTDLLAIGLERQCNANEETRGAILTVSWEARDRISIYYACEGGS